MQVSNSFRNVITFRLISLFHFQYRQNIGQSKYFHFVAKLLYNFVISKSAINSSTIHVKKILYQNLSTIDRHYSILFAIQQTLAIKQTYTRLITIEVVGLERWRGATWRSSVLGGCHEFQTVFPPHLGARLVGIDCYEFLERVGTRSQNYGDQSRAH